MEKIEVQAKKGVIVGLDGKTPIGGDDALKWESIVTRTRDGFAQGAKIISDLMAEAGKENSKLDPLERARVKKRKAELVAKRDAYREVVTTLDTLVLEYFPK